MKKFKIIMLLTLLVPMLSACPQTEVLPPAQTAYEPLLMSRKQLENSVELKAPQPIYSPGKIYLYGSYILINEQFKGVHIINNQNPASPQNIAFIQVPGNIDFAVKENVLYVDNAVDLVAINIADVNNIEITQRMKNVFPDHKSPDGFGSVNRNEIPADAIVVGWVKKQN